MDDDSADEGWGPQPGAPEPGGDGGGGGGAAPGPGAEGMGESSAGGPGPGPTGLGAVDAGPGAVGGGPGPAGAGPGPVEKKRRYTKEEREERRRAKREKKEKKRQARQAAADRRSAAERPSRKRHGGGEDAAGDNPRGATAKAPAKRRKPQVLSEQDASVSGTKWRPQIKKFAEAYVRGVLERMEAAAAEDDASVTARLPALRKLELIDEFCAEASKPKWTQWFLRENLCQTLSRWLAPLPNGALPNVSIRGKILRLLQQLPIQFETLAGTELGPRLVQLWKAPNETAENKNLVATLVTKWLKPAFSLYAYGGGGGGGGGAAGGSAAGSAAASAAPSAPPSSAALLPSGVTSAGVRRARIPRAAGYSFKVMPRSTLDVVDSRTADGGPGKTSEGGGGIPAKGKLRKFIKNTRGPGPGSLKRPPTDR